MRKRRTSSTKMMIDQVARAAVGVVMTLDPQDGDGWKETIIAIMLILGTFVLMFLGREVPTWLVGVVSLVAGAYFGAKATKHTRS